MMIRLQPVPVPDTTVDKPIFICNQRLNASWNTFVLYVHSEPRQTDPMEDFPPVGRIMTGAEIERLIDLAEIQSNERRNKYTFKKVEQDIPPQSNENLKMPPIWHSKLFFEIVESNGGKARKQPAKPKPSKSVEKNKKRKVRIRD